MEPKAVEEGTPKTGSSGKRSTHITWDEETIAEHDKYRGTRQKIDEPPTPYHAPVELADSDSESSRRGSVGSGAGTPNAKKGGPGYLAEHWETLTSALEAAASNQNGSTGEARGSLDESSSSHASCQGGGGSLSSTTSNRRASFSSEDPTCSVKPKTPVEQKKFQAKRLSHYDEYKKLQEWRARRASMSDDDEDDDDDDDAKDKAGGAKG